MEPLRIAIVGVDRYTDVLVDLIGRDERSLLTAICDRRSDVLRRYEREGSTWELFDDPREMILRTRPQVLIAWLAGAQEQYPQLAVDNGVWVVLRTAAEGPAASAAKLMRQARKSGVGAFIWSPWTFIPSVESASEWLVDQQIRSITVRSAVSDKNLDWPGLDNPLAALVYPTVFLAHRWAGLPEKVFCHQLLRSAQDAQTPVQFHCTLSMIYQSTLVDVSAALNAGPDRYQVCIQGSQGTIEFNINRADWYDTGGKLISSSETYSGHEAHRIGYERNLSAIWQAYRQQQRSTEFELNRHIAVMATLEASALSVRTGHPEQIAKVAELSDVISLR